METTTRIHVRGYHEDRFRHVNNARYLEFLEEGRWAHFDECGVNDTFFEENGIFPVVVRINISYRRPASSGDILEVKTRVAEVGSRRVTIAQTATLEGAVQPCVEAEVMVVFLDQTTGRPVPINDALRRVWPDLDIPRETSADF